MSLIQTYHNKDFGIVCSDGRVSVRHADGHYSAVPQETARKWIVLRASPGLVLAGSSSISKWLDFSVCDAVRRYIDYFPEAGFDQVSQIIGPTVYEARAAFGSSRGTCPPTWAFSCAREAGKSAGKMYRFLVGKFSRAPSASPKFFDSTDGNFLNLLGFDPERGCVRNRVFSCTDRCDQSERDSGVTIAGFVDPEEAWEFAGKFLDLVGRENTPRAVVEAMLSIAAEISASHPETVGPPYSFHIVTKGISGAGDIIEEQFRRSLAGLRAHSAAG